MLTDKLRVAKIGMIRTKIVQLLRKIVAKYEVDCSFIAEEMATLLSETGEFTFIRLLTFYSV